jgi:hypothetical protein
MLYALIIIIFRLRYLHSKSNFLHMLTYCWWFKWIVKLNAILMCKYLTL